MQNFFSSPWALPLLPAEVLFPDLPQDSSCLQRLQIKPRSSSKLNLYWSVNSLIFFGKANLVSLSFYFLLVTLLPLFFSWGILGEMCMLSCLFLSRSRVTPLRHPHFLSLSWSSQTWPDSRCPSTQIHLGLPHGSVFHSPMTVVSKYSYKANCFSSKASEILMTYSSD